MTFRVWAGGLMFLGLVACGGGAPPNLCDEGRACTRTGPGELIAVDGDTYEYRNTRLRLRDWDSPESAPHAKCAKEAEAGAEAERRAYDLVNGAQVIEVLTYGRDSYGRMQVEIYLDGVPVGYLLQQEGLAAAWDSVTDARRPDWCMG